MWTRTIPSGAKPLQSGLVWEAHEVWESLWQLAEPAVPCVNSEGTKLGGRFKDSRG
ncbi:DUF309 domain-containing protein (plasmid) [Rhizobium acidisoli]|uniref:DUF309 domain-containing protein n=1 Tax=Rhizobium acidisoli TaxID=1538158 RepID=A0AAE5WRP6_9HYPH|nr:DUF309 domain-containing protein [Rhizobium acidisoli]